ncbi:MAG: enoyl-CoA hydratase-related protein [Burkholderiales bacterium]|jgi:enoyl-CoA hydratase/carnithine racemase|nr:enoyl-CoA hydratase-related protein [Burkholderiales bacterium]
MSAPVYHVVHNAIATVILNKPERLNALDKSMWLRLGAIMRELDGDESIHAVVVRGAGDKAFAAGADIAEFANERATVERAREYGKAIHDTMDAVGACRHPTIAMIRGACVGGGLEIASLCDLRICGESSRFGIPVAKLGLVMAYGELKGLIDLVGRPVAMEILLEGRVFGALEAKEKGIVNRVMADDRVEEEVYATARRIAEGAPLVHRWHKKFARRLADPKPLAPAEYDESFAAFGTEDFRRGVTAFLDKTAPDFVGR